MKKIADGYVPNRCFLYLLEYNSDDHYKKMEENFGTRRLIDLTTAQFWSYFRDMSMNDLPQQFKNQ